MPRSESGLCVSERMLGLGEVSWKQAVDWKQAVRLESQDWRDEHENSKLQTLTSDLLLGGSGSSQGNAPESPQMLHFFIKDS